MAALIDAGTVFEQLVATLSQRGRVYHDTEGWAVEIDGEVWTWATTEHKAHDLAIKLIEAGA
jgi:hypothetical protein